MPGRTAGNATVSRPIMPPNRVDRTFPIPQRAEIRLPLGQSSRRPGPASGASCPGWQRAHRAPRTGHADAGGCNGCSSASTAQRHRQPDAQPCYTPPNTRMAAPPQPVRREAPRPGLQSPTHRSAHAGRILCAAARMARRCWTADPIELQYSCWPELGYWHRNPSVFALLMQHIKQVDGLVPSL